MKLELPPNHPLGDVILETIGPGWRNGGRLFLSLDHFTKNFDVKRRVCLEIELIRKTHRGYEFELSDPMERAGVLEYLTK